MNVGVYVDAYNLYYGARALCGRGVPGWRWLDVRGLAQRVVATRRSWSQGELTRIVYCTARVDARTNLEGHRDQDIYLKALLESCSVDHIEYGSYVARVKRALLATPDNKHRPVPTTSSWPVMVRDANGRDVPDAQFMVQVMNLEEKGSDVNVATHLVLDAARGAVDAAVVISNDSDLRLPLHEARRIIPVGLVNPGKGYCAGALRGAAADGVGNHWWYQLNEGDVLACQLPPAVGPYVRPNGW